MTKVAFYNLRKKLFNPLAWYLSRKELHIGMRQIASNVDQIYKFSEDYIGRGYYASLHSHQNPSEIIALGKMVQEAKPRNILEIGTLKGGTLFLWCRSNPSTDLIISVDLPGGEYGGGYVKSREKLLREFVFDMPNAKMQLIRADSHNNLTLKIVSRNLEGKNLDFLFIDGDHTYEGVKQDFNSYAPFVKKGIIALHDIAHNGDNCGVDRFWMELKNSYQTLEFIEQNSNKGIGVVVLP